MFNLNFKKHRVLRINVLWLIKLRWVVVGFLVLFLLIEKLIYNSNILDERSIIPTVTIILGFFNLLFNIQHTYITKKRKITKGYSIYIFFSQVIIDYICVTLLIYKFGMVPINLAVLYLPHIIITSIMFERFWASLMVMWSSLFVVAYLLYIQEEMVDSVFKSFYSSSYHINGSLSLWFFNAAVFHFVFYLVNLLTGFIVTSRKELQEMNAKLLSIDGEKQKYTLRATHELKSPFSAIQSYINVILEGYVGEVNPQIREIMVKIDKRCTSLIEMIKNIIQLSNLRTSVFEKDKFSEVMLVQFISDRVMTFRSQALNKNLKITFDNQMGKDIGFKVATNLFEILIDNLMANAINYSNKEGVISVRIKLKANNIIICFSDEGIGIDQKHLTNIFSEHFRTNIAASMNPSGNGMGLSLVKEVVQIHGGKINIESEVNIGTEFKIILPIY